jgi:hypothetical protein
VEYNRLVAGISYINSFSQIAVACAVNQTLTLRNWLIGAYIIEYEQNGIDRAAYGTQLIETLAKDLKQRGITGFAISNLRNFRQFSLAYPHLAEETILPRLISFARLSPTEIHQTASGELRSEITELPINEIEISFTDILLFPSLKSRAHEEPPMPWQNAEYYQKLFTTVSWSHLLELCRIGDRLKRAFYELEAVKSNWSLREMKRQMNNMLYERIRLSKDKAAVLTLSQQGQLVDSPQTLIRDPYILEFLGLA